MGRGSYPVVGRCLGIRKADKFNLAFLAKLVWRIINDNESWWVRIVKVKYLRHETIWNVKCRLKQSAAWKGILTRHIVKLGMRWTVGNGQNIEFRTHNWIFPFPLSNIIVIQDQHLIDRNLKVSDVIVDKNWNVGILNPLLPIDVVQKILAIPLPIYEVADKLVWGPNPNGEFSVKSAQRLQVNDNQDHMLKGLLNKIWKLNIPHKIKLFGWLLVRNKLTTNVKLHKFNNTISALCPLCNNGEEDIGHRFKDSSYA